jgi:hypothetical protein
VAAADELSILMWSTIMTLVSPMDWYPPLRVNLAQPKGNVKAWPCMGGQVAEHGIRITAPGDGEAAKQNLCIERHVKHDDVRVHASA